MARRQKLYVTDLRGMGVDFFDCHRVTSKTGAKGWRYILSKNLPEETIENLLKFKNVIIGNCHYKYAPEVKHSTLILMDKCIKMEVE